MFSFQENGIGLTLDGLYPTEEEILILPSLSKDDQCEAESNNTLSNQNSLNNAEANATSNKKRKNQNGQSQNKPSNKRFKFADKTDVPPDATIIQQRKKYIATLPDGSSQQALTASTLSNRHLKFADGTNVPSDVTITQQSRKRFAMLPDGSRQQVFTAATLRKRKRQLKSPDSVSVPVLEKQNNTSNYSNSLTLFNNKSTSHAEKTNNPDPVRQIQIQQQRMPGDRTPRRRA